MSLEAFRGRILTDASARTAQFLEVAADRPPSAEDLLVANSLDRFLAPAQGLSRDLESRAHSLGITLVQNSMGMAVESIGESLKGAVAGATVSLGPAGFVAAVGAVGMAWLKALITGLTKAPASDLRVLEVVGWRRHTSARTIAQRHVEAFGWQTGTWIAGELYAALGFWLGASGLHELGFPAGPRLYSTPLGRYWLALPGSSLSSARHGKHAPAWAAREATVLIDLAAGTVYQNARDAVADDAQWGLGRGSTKALFAAYRKAGAGRDNRGPAMPSVSVATVWGDPSYSDLNLDAMRAAELMAHAVEPHRAAYLMRVYQTFAKALLYPDRWPAHSSGRSFAGPSLDNQRRRASRLAPWERGRSGRIEGTIGYRDRLRRFGWLAPAWDGPGIGSMVARPQVDRWSPLQEILPGYGPVTQPPQVNLAAAQMVNRARMDQYNPALVRAVSQHKRPPPVAAALALWWLLGGNS